MLQSGVTTVSDMFVCSAGRGEPVTPGVVEALDAVGLRGQVSYGAQDQFDPRKPAEVLAEHEALAAAAAASRRCSFRLGIATVLLQSPELFRLSVERARAEGWAVHTHLHEVREEVTASRVAHSKSTIEYAAEKGLMDSPVLAAHCVWVSDEDIRLLARFGATVAHNPVANMILASGVCPVRRLQREGVVVGLGIDGAASNDNQDMFDVIKATPLLQKVHHLDATALTAPDALRMATLDGARALGLDRLIGSLEAGKQADVVLLDGNQPSLLNIHDPCQAVVYGLNGREVSDVWVAGERLLSAGRVATVELGPLFAAAREHSRFLVRQAGLAELSQLARVDRPD
jgi:cytosine/adenosine deaminase-related metal-dependent hydrolase